MNCPLEHKNGAELFVAYAAGVLSHEEKNRFAAHLLDCSKCSGLAQSQLELWKVLDAWTPPPVSADFDAKLYQRIAEAERQSWWHRLFQSTWSWRPALPAGAVCAVLIAAFLMKSPSPAPPVSAPQQLQPEVRIEQVEHALDDIEMLKQAGVYSDDDSSSHSSHKI